MSRFNDKEWLKKGVESAETSVSSDMDEMTAYAYGYLHGARERDWDYGLLKNQIEHLEEQLEEYYNADDQAIDKEMNQLRAANAELVETLQQFTTLCKSIEYHPNEYSRLELGEVYDKAEEVLAKHGGKK